MIRAVLLALAALLSMTFVATPAAAQGQCTFCGDNPPPRGNGGGSGNGGGQGIGNRAVLTIESDIDFGRLIMIGDGVGSVVIDLQSGQKLTMGGLDDLGGVAVRGRAVVNGRPLRAIRIEMPTEITMSDPGGGEARLRDFVTDLPAFPTLDANGELTFTFTGTLYTDSATGVGGVLRGRVPIRVRYD